MMIDTHCHLYANAFKGDIDQVIQRARNAGVQRFYLPAIDSATTDAMFELEARYPNECIAMMGLHPCHVTEGYQQELDHVRKWLEQRPFVAVGEIGLDHYWDKTHVKEQEAAFRTQIEWALEFSIPVVIHTRNAMQDTINIVKEYTPRGLQGIFHCFSGSFESAREIIKAGFYLGIGGVVTYPKAGLAEVLEKIDLEHLVLETDAPYLTPVPFRGKRNESSYLTYIAGKLADIKQVSPETVAAITTANAQKIFGA